MQKTQGYIWKYAKQYYLLIIVGFVFLILAKVAATTEPVFLRNIINGLTAHNPLSAILVILGIYFLLKLGEAISEFLRDWILAPVIMGISRDFEKSVFQKLLTLPVSYHADQKTGAAARSVTRGSQAVSFILDFSVSQFLPPFFELIFVSALLFKLYSWHYSVITIVTIIIYGFFTIWGTEKRIKYREGANINDDSASAVLVDSVANIETVKYFHNEKLQSEKFSNSKQRWFNFAVQDNRVFASVYGGQELILYFGLGLILYVAVRQASVGIMSVGDLVLVSTYIVRLSAPLTSLGFIYGRFKNSFADIKAMATILDVKNTILEPNNPKKISKPKGAVEFKNVTFSYNNKRQIISALNFKILPGQRVAFVGPSGAGKSTIAKLIFRLYDVSSGKILLDGVDVKNLANVERGKILAIVPQDPALFNDTISANIKFAKPQASDDEVIKATKSAQIDDFIKTLPQQYDTMVGERGVKISGGERQRVAIARAMICNPKILVFDEATSSLDSHSEQKVLETINQVAQGRTSISIAHRLSTIVNSDIIFVLKGGKIVEQGTHLELLKKSGVYAKLWAIQTHENS